MTEGDKPTETVSFAVLGRRVTLPLALLGFFGVVLTALGALGGSWIALLTKDHELKIRLVEIGIGILRADPKEKITPARGWAIRVIQSNSGENFTPDEMQALLDQPLVTLGYADTFGNEYGKATYGTTDAYPHKSDQPLVPVKPQHQ